MREMKKIRLLILVLGLVVMMVSVCPAQRLQVSGVDAAFKGFWYDVRVYGTEGDGVTDDSTEVGAADTAAAAAGAYLYFAPGTYRISANTTIDADAMFASGAMLTIDSGKVVTFTADIVAGVHQIFSGSGTVTIVSSTIVSQVARAYPQWWGATGDGSTDDTTAIQAAVTACRSYFRPIELYFPACKYKLTSPITIDRGFSINGAGRGVQIYQSADEHLFYIVPYAADRADASIMKNIGLASGATTSGKALIYMDDVSDSIFENLALIGSYAGISMAGDCHRNTFLKIQSFGNPLWHHQYGNFSTNVRWVNMHTTNNNANVFINCLLNKGTYAYYVTAANSTSIYGGTIEGADVANQLGAYFSGTDRLLISGLHMETDTLDLHLVNCYKVTLDGVRGEDLTIENCHMVSGRNLQFTGDITIDKRSQRIDIDPLWVSSGYVPSESGSATIGNIYDQSSGNHTFAGVTARPMRNLVCGDMEWWVSGLPKGFTAWQGGQSTDEESTWVMFGDSSAKLTIGGGNGKAGLKYVVQSYKRYTHADADNLVRAKYKWTVSPADADEYYVDLLGGGDPAFEAKPEGVVINASFRTEGTMGSLAANEWDWGDNDTLGYDTVYVNIGGDPDGQASEYVKAVWKIRRLTLSAWVLRESGSELPRLSIEFTGKTEIDAFAVETGQWKRISRTFDILPGYSLITCNFSYAAGAGNNGDVMYFDGIQIVEGDMVNDLYDDSTDVRQDFFVAADLHVDDDLTVTDDSTFTDKVIASAGVRIGADSTDNLIDDASNGAGTTVLYIGNVAISTSFTGAHYYQLGDTDLEVGECVILDDGKVYRATKQADKKAVGIFWGIPAKKDSMGNLIRSGNGSVAPSAYAVAVMGDSIEEHDKMPLTGAWVSAIAGDIEEGDLLCSSSKPGWLEKQTSGMVLDTTVAKAGQKVTSDTKEAYILFLR